MYIFIDFDSDLHQMSNMIMRIFKSMKLKWTATMSLLFMVTSFGGCTDAVNVDSRNSIVWGPGLKADFTVPARYFYIQAVDTSGNK